MSLKSRFAMSRFVARRGFDPCSARFLSAPVAMPRPFIRLEILLPYILIFRNFFLKYLV